MTALQAIELDMLRAFLRVCEQLQLRYFLVCGSALGAVKYGGFIPWDDDMDVALPRADYERFIREAPALLPPELFLQNATSDPQFPLLFSKLRHSGTTYVEATVAHVNMHHGVYIDIFPLDGYPTEEGEQATLEAIKASCQKKLSCVFHIPRALRGRIGYALRRALGYHKRTAEIVATYTEAIARYDTEQSERWCNHGNWQGQLEYAPREQYGDGAMMTFEGVPVRVPQLYDAYLTQKYGDWRADPPKEQQIGHHFYERMDLERPYTEYIKRVVRGGRELRWTAKKP